MLLFGKEDGKVIIKAGTLNQIMLHLTSPLDNAADALAGSDFYRTFMMTLQTFIEPEIFVQKMIERYNVPAAPPNVPEEDYAHDVKNPVQMRVCNLLYVPKAVISSLFFKNLSQEKMDHRSLRSGPRPQATADRRLGSIYRDRRKGQ